MNYRLDIQGLRAVAIAAVVIYHLNPGWLPGGFIGVDVFFVISGYLITMMLYTGRADANSLLKFYSSRILRLFPAYFVMLAACAIAGYLWLFPLQMVEFAKSLFSAVFYVSNIYFASTINYLTVDTHLLALLHTWSLSAEAQCYLVFPLILFFIVRHIKIRAGLALFLLAVVLFGLNILLTAYNSDVAFFSPSVRLYQFLAGAVLVFVPDRIHDSRNLMRLCLSAGLLVVALSFFIINPLTVYPGIYSLLPTLGSMLIILSGQQHRLRLANLLTNAPMVFLGAISYSLYLWHWPVIVFYKTAINPLPQLLDYALLVGLSLCLATLSWYFIENRLRKIAGVLSTKDIYRISVIASAVLISVSVLFLETNGLHHRFSERQLYLAQTDFSQDNLGQRTTDACMVYKNWTESFTRENCVHLSDQKSNILLLGDSHAEHFRRALEDHGDNISLSVATVSGCRPTYPGSGRKTCQTMMRRFYQDLIKNNRFDARYRLCTLVK